MQETCEKQNQIFINVKDSCLKVVPTYAISVSSSGSTSVFPPFIPGVLANTSLPSNVVSSNAPSKAFIALEPGVLLTLFEGETFPLIA